MLFGFLCLGIGPIEVTPLKIKIQFTVIRLFEFSVNYYIIIHYDRLSSLSSFCGGVPYLRLSKGRMNIFSHDSGYYVFVYLIFHFFLVKFQLMLMLQLQFLFFHFKLFSLVIKVELVLLFQLLNISFCLLAGNYITRKTRYNSAQYMFSVK